MNAMRHMPDRSEALLSRDELDQLWAISSDLQNERAAFKKQNTHHLYMQFLQLSNANASQKSWPTLSLNEHHLLEQIAVRCEAGKPVTVSEACLMRQFGCISTVHHQLQKLSAADLIHFDVDHKDRRKKSISLSAHGLEYFEQIEDCLDKALMRQ